MASARVTRVIGLAIGLAAVVAILIAGCGSGNGDLALSGQAQGQGVVATAEQSAHAEHGGAQAVAAPITPLRAGERFKTLWMPRAYVPNPPAHGTDDYRCFLVNPKLTTDAFLTGSQFLPNNASIVHHAIFFKVDQQDVGQAKALDAASPGDGWTCFSGTGIGSQGDQLQGAPWLAAWAPGATESLAAKGTGTRMEAGSQIVMQVHYNLLATGGRATAADRSGIRLRLAPGTAKLEPLHTTLLVAPVELPCPAGETGQLCDRDLSIFDEMRRFGPEAGTTVAGLNLLCNQGDKPKPGNTQHCDTKAHQTMVVQAVAGHMHLLGRSIKVQLNPGTAKAKTLLDVPVYNFDDQGARALAKPITVKAGDDLRVTCTHDATLRSQIPALQTLKPRYVVWGEGTSDEMCLGVVIWSAKPAAVS
jgi:Copper type II ascorbate-dependent monooxygenase, C-terminal domain